MTATHNDDRSTRPAALHLAFELGWTEWKVAFTTDPAQKPRVRKFRARDLDAVHLEIAKAKTDFGLPADAPVHSCYEAGRDGFWLHRHLTARGVHNLIVDSASIEVNRRQRRAKTDTLDARKLVSMLLRYLAGEKKVWSVVRVPEVAAEDDRQWHRDLEALKDERTGHTNCMKGPTKPERPRPMPSANRVTAKYPNHVWHVDLTTVPILGGSWASWLPHALPPVWPFCWWLAIVLDHYSRRVMGITVFVKQPTAEQIKQFMGRVIAKAGQAPKHLISDRGVQFVSKAFQEWCRGRGIRQRFGAVGQSGSIAVIERFIKTLKYEGLRLLPVVPMVRRAFLREVNLFASWYNGERPHTTLKGATPDER